MKQTTRSKTNKKQTSVCPTNLGLRKFSKIRSGHNALINHSLTYLLTRCPQVITINSRRLCTLLLETLYQQWFDYFRISPQTNYWYKICSNSTQHLITRRQNKLLITNITGCHLYWPWYSFMNGKHTMARYVTTISLATEYRRPPPHNYDCRSTETDREWWMWRGSLFGDSDHPTRQTCTCIACGLAQFMTSTSKVILINMNLSTFNQ